jgi:DNA-binding beta-propeller fold protein YncE
MSRSHRAGVAFRVLIVAVLATCAHSIASPGSDPPNFYRAIENWAQLPPGVQWGQVINVAPDAHGNIWVFHRSDPAILEFDASGKALNSFGAGMFVQAHGLAVDSDGNIWVTDAQGKDGKGQQVFKFSPEGKILMTLGKPGVAGTGTDTFNGPSGVAVASNGDIFVADGHGGDTNARIVKFSKDGTFISQWGKKGSGPGEFDTPHGIALDSKGRVFVADRVNNRIQVFDRDGKFIDQWKQFGRPSGIFISRDDTLYSVDSQSDEKTNPGVKRGIRVGSAKTGKVKAFIPDPSPNPQIALAEGVCADAKGNIYAAGVSSMALHKFVKQ